MKRLTCEMCGSTDMIKQDGVFVCQSCGCKYSVEEARKLMVEGAAEVTGTVKVDNIAQRKEQIKNLLHIAETALEDGEWKSADHSFEQVLNIDAECGEAYLGKALAAQKHHSFQELVENWKIIVPETETMIACQSDSARMDEIVKRYAYPPYLTEVEIRQAIQEPSLDFTYQSAVNGYKQLMEEANTYFIRDELMGRAARYSSGELAAQIEDGRQEVQAALDQALTKARKEDEEHIQEIRSEYEAFLNQADADASQFAIQYLKQVEKDASQRIQSKKERATQKKKLSIIAAFAAVVVIIAVIVIIIIMQIARIITSRNKYQDAEALLASGDTVGAAMAFGSAGGYQDARERSMALWEKIATRDTLAASTYHTVGLKADGTVVAVGDNAHGECDVENWQDIVAVTAGAGYTVGLQADGTVVATNCNDDGQCDLDDWKDIVTVTAGSAHTVGLRTDGTVVAVGNDYVGGPCGVENWQDIVAIAAGGSHTIGLRADGTVVAVGNNNYGQCDVENWRDIVAIAAGGNNTMGLRADGTVVAVGNDHIGEHDVVESWQDIVAIETGNSHMVGLRADGTVVAVSGAYGGYFNDGECDVENWQGIVAIAAGGSHTLGLRADGTVVAVGFNNQNQCDVDGWTNIKPIPLGLTAHGENGAEREDSGSTGAVSSDASPAPTPASAFQLQNAYGFRDGYAVVEFYDSTNGASYTGVIDETGKLQHYVTSSNLQASLSKGGYLYFKEQDAFVIVTPEGKVTSIPLGENLEFETAGDGYAVIEEHKTGFDAVEYVYHIYNEDGEEVSSYTSGEDLFKRVYYAGEKTFLFLKEEWGNELGAYSYGADYCSIYFGECDTMLNDQVVTSPGNTFHTYSYFEGNLMLRGICDNPASSSITNPGEFMYSDNKGNYTVITTPEELHRSPWYLGCSDGVMFFQGYYDSKYTFCAYDMASQTWRGIYQGQCADKYYNGNDPIVGDGCVIIGLEGADNEIYTMVLDKDMQEVLESPVLGSPRKLLDGMICTLYRDDLCIYDLNGSEVARIENYDSSTNEEADRIVVGGQQQYFTLDGEKAFAIDFSSGKQVEKPAA